MIEDDDCPWGALVILAAKPHQEGVLWEDFRWRLCVLYHRLNQVTRPFAFPIPRCNNAVEEIDTEARYFVAIDLNSGYWQVVAEPEARSRLAFFMPDGKKRWKVMPMGALNSAPTFIAMMMHLQARWEKLAAERGILGCGSKVIVDDVLIYGRKKDQLLQYFRSVLNVLKHYRATINLRKCKWFHSWCEFVGVDVGARGNSPARSKFTAFEKLGQPHTWADLRMLAGVFGFYNKHLPLYELRITPWRRVLVAQPPPGEMSRKEEVALLASI